MSKACNIAFCVMCARAILDRVSIARGMMGAAGKARHIEAVHDMRVASRRLRAALALFELCMPSDARLWRKDVRRITKALGWAKDLDVQIETVESAIKKHSSWRVGLEGILDGLKDRRREAQQKVVKSLDKTIANGVLERIEATLAPVAAAMPDDGMDWRSAYRQGQTMILDLLDDLKSYERDLSRPKAAGRHHKMRIAAKRLRYSLEVLEPMYGHAIEAAIRGAKRMQTLLGDMHDCDVWESSLSQFLADAGTGAKAPKAIRAFARDRRARRQKLYEQAKQCWQKCKKDRVWQRLRHTLREANSQVPPSVRLAESQRRSRPSVGSMRARRAVPAPRTRAAQSR